MADRDQPDSDFLDRFDEEPQESGTVVKRAFPKLQDEEAPSGPVEEGEPPWRKRRWARWIVVGVIWLVALMLVGSVLLRAV